MLLVLIGTIVRTPAQGLVATLDDFDAAMKVLGDASAIVESAVASPTYLLNSVRGDALTRVGQMRDHLGGVRGFFTVRKLVKGVQQADRTLRTLGDLREELARAEPDQAAAQDAWSEVSSSCAACHAMFREGNERDGYRFRAGSIPEVPEQ